MGVTDSLHGAGSSLRIWYLLSRSRQYIFMDPEIALPCSQKPTAGLDPEPVQCNPHLHTIFTEDSL